jgi:hypothetical protein
MPGPWHSFTIFGTARMVRMVRQYDGGGGTVWRDYQNERGQVICVQAKGPGGKRTLADKATARVAANRFAGNL